MKMIRLITAILLSLLFLLSTLCSCSEVELETTDGPSPEASTAESPSPHLTSSDLLSENVDELLIAAYNKTVSCSSLTLSGKFSKYQLINGRSFTFNVPVSFVCKEQDETFTASLTHSGNNVELSHYYSGNEQFVRTVDNTNHTDTVEKISLEKDYDISTSILAIFKDYLTIDSYTHLFEEFAKTDYEVKESLTTYSLYADTGYDLLYRLLLEDEAYEKYYPVNTTRFPDNGGTIELIITKDGYFAGMSISFFVASDTQESSTMVYYTFSDFNASDVSPIEQPDWISRAE